MTNSEVARILREMAVYLDMNGVQFKPRAYEKAADAIESFDAPLFDLYATGGLKAVLTVPHVGRGIAERIEELIKTGKVADHQTMYARIPVDVSGLMAIGGIGPKMIKTLYEELGVRSVEDLEQAARAGRVRQLSHFGEKTEQKILQSIEFVKQLGGRKPIGEVVALAQQIAARLRDIRGVTEVAIAGSLRRRKETIGDLDFLVVAENSEKVMETFTAMDEVVAVHGKGSTKSSVRLANGMDADLRVVRPEQFGAALVYFTGSKDHCVAIRRIAQERGLKLNEYGIFRGEEAVGGRSEEEVYAALGLPFIPPELRENAGEIEAARAGTLPELIEPGQVLGDLQIQTTWTDGVHSLEEMVEAARLLGRKYIAITDHTRGLTMMRGSDEAQLVRQRAVIDALNRKSKGIRVLAGAEVNIDRDGALDIADEALAKLDVVGVAVHSHFNLPRAEMTRRIIRAMENPHADILFHPTGRALGRRQACDIDMDAVIAAAKRTGTILEIDAYPERLDLKDEHVRKAVNAGVPLVIDSDAHHMSHLKFVDDFGVFVARRGWATRADVINTLPVDDFLARLKDGKVKPARSKARPKAR